jgi:adenylate cyclase
LCLAHCRFLPRKRSSRKSSQPGSKKLAAPRIGDIVFVCTPDVLHYAHARAISDLATAQERGESSEEVIANLRREGASVDELELLSQAAGEMRRVDELFRPYLPGQVAERLRREPALAELGGVEREVTVLFADLAGFTTFSETRPPTEVIHMLNRHWEAVVPIIEQAGGIIEHFAGDGVMAIFNAVGDQTDHASRAASAALGIVRTTAPLAEGHPGWPRFRIGVNTGPAVVGNVGAAGRRTFGAIGDTSNLGARLMSAGEPGQVVVARSTWEALSTDPDRPHGRPLGAIQVKGKQEPVEAWVLDTIGAVTA